MTTKIRVNMKDLIRFAKDERDFAKTLTDKIAKAVTATTMETHAEVVQNEPVFKGLLNNNTKFKAPITRGRGMIKIVSGEIFLTGAAALYGNVQDLGRTPGKPMPPHGPIRRWVTLKADRGTLPYLQWRPGTTKRRAIDRTTFVIRRKISKKPAAGLKFFEKAEAGALLRLQRRVDDVADEISRGMGGS